jgi:HlyD family secretion protein
VTRLATCGGRRLPFDWRVLGRIVAVATLLTSAQACGRSDPSSASTPTPATTTPATEPGPAPRLSGTVEAVQLRTVSVPRLQGPLVPLLIVNLVKAGTRVKQGDTLVEFDPQQQERAAFDRRAELINLQGEVDKKRAEHTAAEAKDRTELTAAEHDVDRARLEVRMNELIPKIDAEKNTLALTQAMTRFEQLKVAYELKREAARAELRILEIRRDRAESALGYSEQNARLMTVAAPFEGLVVIKRTYRNGTFVEIAEGDEVRPGTPIVDIVDTTNMRVRARVNQADFRLIRIGQRATIGLDGFPDLSFKGKVELVTPLAVSSQLSTAVRSFVAVIAIEGTHAQLLPDLTAWVDLLPESGSPMTETAERTP